MQAQKACCLTLMPAVQETKDGESLDIFEVLRLGLDVLASAVYLKRLREPLTRCIPFLVPACIGETLHLKL